MQLYPARAGETTAILDDFRRIVSALREASRAAEGLLGVSGAQLFVLRTLAQVPALSIGALAARTRTHQSTVSVVVKRLVEAGFVKRTESKLDGRQVELTVTRSGRALLERAPPAVQDRFIQGIDALPRSERRQLAQLLHRLAETIRPDTAAPSMFFEEEPAAQRKQRKRHAR
ncbi:MAG TPA: MarR family transcriptional regulator [Polyangiaceae bacterium]|nr:MarR family transcriptional regulator [Polyangiaceae bacterium]